MKVLPSRFRARAEHELENVFGRELLAMSRPDREYWTWRAVEYWRRKGFPFPVLSRAEIALEFEQLTRVAPNALVRNGVVAFSAAGLRLANAYHPQMWNARIHDHLRSPLDYFDDDAVLYKMLERSVRFWPDRRCWNAQCLRSAFRIYGGGRVSNFRPTAARALMDKFSSDGDTVLDFSAGYGGRLLGALTLRRHYIGIDPDPSQHSGLMAMNKGLLSISLGKAELHRERAENFIQGLPPGSIDLIISSPPYFRHEKYSTHPAQSSSRYQSYSEWKARFLIPVLRESRRVLRVGGFVVVNVKDTRDHAVASDTKLCLDALLTRVAPMKLAMRARPQRSESVQGNEFRSEPLLIYRKGTRASARVRC